MNLTTKIIIGLGLFALLLWGVEALLVGHFTNQFAAQTNS